MSFRTIKPSLLNNYETVKMRVEFVSVLEQDNLLKTHLTIFFKRKKTVEPGNLQTSPFVLQMHF